MERMYIHLITTLLCLSTYAITSTSLVISSSPAASLSTTNTVTVNSATTNPASTRPASTNPASTNPASTNPASTNPATTRPAATPCSTALRSKATKLIKTSILLTNITAITQANNVSYSNAVGETTTRAINNTATTGFESSNETTDTITLSSNGKIYNISATTQNAAFPDVVQCGVTQEMCENYEHSDTTAWHIMCYKYGDRVRLCSSICSMKKREPRCADECPDYKAACIQITLSLVPTTPQRGERFPDVVRCDVTWEMCERYGDSPTTAWNTTCFKYGESIRPCSSICSMKKREPRCTDYCPDYKAACIWLTSTTSLVPTTPQRGERFPDVVRCDVTRKMCERYGDSPTTAWHITCYKYGDRVRPCSTICSIKKREPRCTDDCPDYKAACIWITSTPSLVPTTHQSGVRFPDVLQCDVTQDMCERYADSKTSAWNITCFAHRRLEETTIRLCSSICLSENDGKRVKCSEDCPDFRSQCVERTTPEEYTTTAATVPPIWDKFPYVPQCNVTLEMCDKYSQTAATAWNITCFAEKRFDKTLIKLCSSICLSEGNDGKRVKCSEVCPDYSTMCLNESTITSTTTTVVPATSSTQKTAAKTMPSDGQIVGYIFAFPILCLVALYGRRQISGRKNRIDIIVRARTDSLSSVSSDVALVDFE